MPDQPIETKDTSKRYQCRHVFTEGRRCGSPCLRGEDFCYYHHQARRAAEMRVRDCRDREGPFELPSVENRTGIQTAIGEVLQRIAVCSIDHKRAGLLLYGLQIASINLSKPGHIEQHTTDAERITDDLVLGSLAPRKLIAAPGEAIDETEEIPEEEANAETPKEPKDENSRPRSIAELKDGYYRALDRIERQVPQSQSRTPNLRDGIFAQADEPKQSPSQPPKPEPAIPPSLHACQSSAEDLPELLQSIRQPFLRHSTLSHSHSAAKRRNLLFPPSARLPFQQEGAAKRPRNRGASANQQQGLGVDDLAGMTVSSIRHSHRAGRQSGRGERGVLN